MTATDKAVGTIYDAAYKHGYVLLITSDHGNAEQMKDPKTGNPHTAHTTNLVPFLMAGFGESKGLKFKEDKPKEVKGKEKEKEKPSEAKGEEKEKEKEDKTNEAKDKEKEKDSKDDEDPPALCDVAPTVLDVMVRPFAFFELNQCLESDSYVRVCRYLKK